ncbi:hypothetical protein [Streptomyces sp. NPDC004682]
MKHRKPHTRLLRSRVAGIGVAATAAFAATATVPATAVTLPTAPTAPSGAAGKAAIAVDLANSRADRTHMYDFDESFRIHEYGPTVAVTANNRATAMSVGCSADAPCRSVALSFQIVTTAGSNARLINATNLSRASNEHCPSCETLSAAYQFVVATPREFHLSKASRSELAGIQRQVDALRTSRLPIARIRERADALAQQVKVILDRETARAPRGDARDPRTNFAPTVTMHRHIR